MTEKLTWDDFVRLEREMREAKLLIPADAVWYVIAQEGSPAYEYWWDEIFGNCSYGI